MKKYHSLPAFFLSLVLLTGLCVPAATQGQEEAFDVNATAAILIDADYDEVLYEKAADERRYPASITKVMTGLLTLEAIDRGDPVFVNGTPTGEAITMDTQVTLGDTLYLGIGEGGSTQGLKVGEILTVRDLLNCALIPSANEACNALAQTVAGSIPAFVERMNTRAAEIGMASTHFANTHGYHNDDHYTTARDVARMCQEAMRHPEFREIVSSVSYTVPATNMTPARNIHDTNYLISNFISGRSDLLYRYAIGIKTGSTPEAGHCLASAAEKNGRTMIAVLLQGESVTASPTANYFVESKRLLEHGFNDFARTEVLSPIEPIRTVPVTLCAQQDYVTVQPAQGLEATLPKEMDSASFTREIDLPDTLEAPIQKGQVLGTIRLRYGNRDFGTVDLVATADLERSQGLYILQCVRSFFSHTFVKVLLLAVVLLLLIVVLRTLVFGRRRRGRYNSPKVYSSSYRGGKSRKR